MVIKRLRNVMKKKVTLDDSNDATKTTTELWNYFESETATTSICCVCCASVSNKPAELRRHLVTEHPKLLGEYLSQDSDHDESYSEVIYLEEDTNTKEHKIRVKKINVDGYKRSKTKKRRCSEGKSSKSVETEEADAFGAYITCLLKQLPREVWAPVQRDIINIILNARTCNQVNMETQQNLVKEIMKEINCDDPKPSERSLDVRVEDGDEKGDEKADDGKSDDDKDEEEE